MFKRILKAFRSGYIENDLTNYYPVLRQIRERESFLKNHSDNQLKTEAIRLRQDVHQGAELTRIVGDVFGLVSEVAFRVLRMRPYDVQIIAALALYESNVIEMQTGEGKTLVATMPAFLYSLTGNGVHVHTFNDYLAKRDALWMKPVYDFLGASVGYLQEEMKQPERKEVYQRDIVYMTAKEGGFDYLRTFLVRNTRDIVQRRAGFAIIDEVDSLLIDEARIPLVIAGDFHGSKTIDLYRIAEIVGRMRRGLDFQTDQFGMNIFLTDSGIRIAEESFNCPSLFDDEFEELLVRINQSLHAHFLLRRDIDYIVNDDRIALVDEFTGRVVDNRKWPHGLQAAIEAKEKITIQPEGKIIGKSTLQHFFGMYPRICGMTGTAQPAAEEFADMYGVPVVVVPPNKPNRRIDHPDVIFPDKEMKTNAIIDEIKKVQQTGRPILVGTASIKESESIAYRLLKQGVSCRILNAKNDEEEAAIIAEAGMWGAVTISTNMAGRGTDIKLGGDAGVLRDKIIELGGLYVIGTNRFESRRIDNQLRGRSGRQGDPGEARFFISLKDDLLQKHGINQLIPKRYRNSLTLSALKKEIINREVNRAQRIIEGKNFDIRKTLWKYASFIEIQRKIVHQLRQQALDGILESIVNLYDKAFYDQLIQHHGEDAVRKAEAQITMAIIDQCWADYMEDVDLIRQSIHMVTLGGLNPFREFQKRIKTDFDELLERIDQEIMAKMKTVTITADGIDFEKEGLLGPSSTWTYLVNDNPFGDRLAMMLNASGNIGFAAGAALLWPLLSLYFIVTRQFRKKNEPNV